MVRSRKMMLQWWHSCRWANASSSRSATSREFIAEESQLSSIRPSPAPSSLSSAASLFTASSWSSGEPAPVCGNSSNRNALLFRGRFRPAGASEAAWPAGEASLERLEAGSSSGANWAAITCAMLLLKKLPKEVSYDASASASAFFERRSNASEAGG